MILCTHALNGTKAVLDKTCFSTALLIAQHVAGKAAAVITFLSITSNMHHSEKEEDRCLFIVTL